MAESKYAQELRNLGFTKLSPELIEFMNRELEAKKRRFIEKTPGKLGKIEDEVKMDKIIRSGFFKFSKGETIATDELLEHWICKGEVDLSFLGFSKMTGTASSEVSEPIDHSKTNN